MLQPDVANAESTATVGSGDTRSKDRRKEEVWEAQHATTATEDAIITNAPALESVSGTGEGRVKELLSIGKGFREAGDVAVKAVALRLART